MTITCRASEHSTDFIREIQFASCYVYSPCGMGMTSGRSRLMRAMLKDRDAEFLRKYAGRVHQQACAESPLTGFFPRGCVLVPVPGSAPSTCARASVAAELAIALLQQGLGGMVWNGLRRVRAVRKSATAPPGLRPTVMDHYASFRVDAFQREMGWPHHLVLVDDVVTKGRTLLAAAARLHESFSDGAGPRVRIDQDDGLGSRGSPPRRSVRGKDSLEHPRRDPVALIRRPRGAARLVVRTCGRTISPLDLTQPQHLAGHSPSRQSAPERP